MIIFYSFLSVYIVVLVIVVTLYCEFDAEQKHLTYLLCW